jgi:hypothetical protein
MIMVTSRTSGETIDLTPFLHSTITINSTAGDET